MATMLLPFQLTRGRPRRKVDVKSVVELRARGLSWRGKRLGGWHRNGVQGRSKNVP